MKRLPVASDFEFLAPLWEMVKNPRNGLLCEDKIPAMMTRSGWVQNGTYQILRELNPDTAWSNPAFYGQWAVEFNTTTETLSVFRVDVDAWNAPEPITIEGFAHA